MKKLLALLLLVAFVVSIAGCGSKKDSGLEDDQSQSAELVWYLIGPKPKDFDKVMAKVNEYTKEKLNCTIKAEMIDFGDYDAKMKTVATAGDNVDIMFTCSWAFDYKQNAMRGVFYPLTELLPKYGQDMTKLMDPRLFEASKINGVNYVIPANMGAFQQSYIFDKKFVGQYGFDFAAVKKESDLIPLFDKVRAANPGMKMLRHSSWVEGRDIFDYVFSAGFPGAVRFTDNSCKVVNQFEDPEFIAILKDCRKMYQGEYTYRDLKEGTDSDFNAGKVVCEVQNAGGPFVVTDVERVTGFPVIVQPVFAKPIITTDIISGSMMAISATSKNPARAMKLINMLNSDPYLHNLLAFGIENEHYKKLNDKQIEITKLGKENYTMPVWTLGNNKINYLLSDQPLDYNEKMQAYTDSAAVSPIFGFVFDPSPVLSEIGALNNINAEYITALKSGSVDVDAGLKDYNAKIKAAGWEKVLAELQKQVDEWKKTKK